MKNKFENFLNNLTQEEKNFFLDIKKEYLKEKENIRLQKIKLEKQKFKTDLISSKILPIEAKNYIRDKKLKEFLFFLEKKDLIILHVNHEDYEKIEFIINEFGIYCLENFDYK